MKQVARLGLLLALLAACAPDSRSEAERLADAARADSSAAGYDVGVSAGEARPGTPAPPRNGPGTSGRHGSADASGQTARTGAVRPAGVGSTLTSVPQRASYPGRRPATVLLDTTAGALPADPAMPTLPPIREAAFLTYDTAHRSITFQLTAGDEIPDRVSFNGSVDGTRELTVPRGWAVTVNFTNRDPVLPHSATVVSASATIGEALPEPAFAGAATIRVGEGLLDGSGDEMTFIADREGSYRLACAVFGHAQRGQWITLVVSASAAVPRYR